MGSKGFVAHVECASPHGGKSALSDSGKGRLFIFRLDAGRPWGICLNHRNNFDFVRLVAAFSVMVSHQYALRGLPEPEWSGGSFGGLGVLVFFAVSGYLVAGSWTRDSRVLAFAAKRWLRIWPGLFVSIVLTVLVLGPLASELTPDVYLRSGQTWHYFWNLDLMHFEWSLPGVFEQRMASSAVNGSLWTIPIEVRCYAFLGLMGVMGVMKQRFVFLALWAAAAVFFLLLSRMYSIELDRMHVQLGIVFFGAAALQLFQAQWLRYRYILLICFLTWSAFVWNSQVREAALTLCLPVVVVVLGMASTPILRRFGRFGDLSYGLYIYAFPVQQTVLWSLGGHLSLVQSFAISALTCACLAWLSWHCIEKRALRWKRTRLSTGRSLWWSKCIAKVSEKTGFFARS
jgi:peptidoglycan/LPS O-acetylase OafA/YrhL